MRDERLFALFAESETLPGIGPKTRPVLERLVGGSHVLDVLLHLPERWLDRRVRKNFDETEIDEVATVSGEVQKHTPPYSEKMPYKVRLADETGFLTLVFFRADPRWLVRELPEGETRIVSGRIEDFQGGRQMVHPDYIINPAKDAPPPPVEPIYPLTAGLTNKRLHTAMIAALEAIPDDLPEWIDAALLQERNWPGFKQAFGVLHAPTLYDEASFKLARERLAYDEAMAREATFAAARAARQKRPAPSLDLAPEAQQKLIASLPFKPTNAQIRATREIGEAMASAHPMRQMLQGDVGSGKTLVGALASIQATEAGFQTAFMAPTEVLARQQYRTLDEMLSPLGYAVAALTGRDKGAAREGILFGLADGSIQIVAGTHALFQESVSFRKLGLIIVDEQHRFGVMDRARLADKAPSPHILVMSATPIPRTLAMAVNGDLDMSILDEMPEGRKPVTTRVLPDTRIEEVVAAVGKACLRGEHVFWICPKVDMDDDASTAVGRHAALREQLNVSVGLVHGRMKPLDKDAALEDFRTGKTKVLVATTVVEVGVDVSDATIMVIERAEGFGLAQLHQLRGRVGRGDKQSFCLLMYRPPLGEAAKERLETLRKTDDGFEIADADYRLRGPGDVLGLRQAGAALFRIIDLRAHAALIEIARKDVRMLAEKDPEFKSARGVSLGLLRELLSPRVALPKE